MLELIQLDYNIKNSEYRLLTQFSTKYGFSPKEIVESKINKINNKKWMEAIKNETNLNLEEYKSWVYLSSSP